nr:MAG TPA: hypothetical protein [Crassvirales sp.]
MSNPCVDSSMHTNVYLLLQHLLLLERSNSRNHRSLGTIDHVSFLS